MMVARSLKNHFAAMILPKLFHCLKARWQDDGGKIIKKSFCHHDFARAFFIA
jgi:hypothetical protein